MTNKGGHMKTQTTPQHTPTPWKIAKYGHVITEGMTGLDSVCTSGLGMSHSEEAKANTVFIVKAVNSHEELLEACKQARKFVSEHKDGDTRYLDSIIARAEGKESI
jgi:hypothetical protein